MDTDILAGIQSEIRTVLVLSGVTSVNDLPSYAYHPDIVLDTIGHIVPGFGESESKEKKDRYQS